MFSRIVTPSRYLSNKNYFTEPKNQQPTVPFVSCYTPHTLKVLFMDIYSAFYPNNGYITSDKIMKSNSVESSDCATEICHQKDKRLENKSIFTL